jgi:hypothetical protein
VYVYGNKDEILVQTQFDEFLTSLKQAVPTINIIEFEGGHQINTKVLKQIFESLLHFYQTVKGKSFFYATLVK